MVGLAVENENIRTSLPHNGAIFLGSISDLNVYEMNNKAASMLISVVAPRMNKEAPLTRTTG
jgi:hypothetical protein